MWRFPWVELLADEIRHRARVGGPPYNVINIAEALGYRVRFAQDLGGPVGVLMADVITVLRGACVETVAMTVGHELAHVFNDRWRVIPEQPECALEFQMDAVAAALLMPRADLAIAAWRGAALRDIARTFAPIPRTWAAMRVAWTVGIAICGGKL